MIKFMMRKSWSEALWKEEIGRCVRVLRKGGWGGGGERIAKKVKEERLRLYMGICDNMYCEGELVRDIVKETKRCVLGAGERWWQGGGHCKEGELRKKG